MYILLALSEILVLGYEHPILPKGKFKIILFLRIDLLKNQILTEKGRLIELLYDEDLVQAGEQLYDGGAVHDISKLEANLFIARVRDGKMYEVEVQSPFAKKQKTSCECTFFAQNKVCRHVVALLFALRNAVSDQPSAAEKTGKPKAPAKPVSLNVAHILDEISHEELVSFVRNYARNDKKFATQLKVNFARKIDLVDNVDKYRNLLNSLVKPHTGQASKANASEIRGAALVLEEFADQISDCIALRQFREAFDILNSAFAKLEYIRHHYAAQSDNLASLGVTYHRITKELLAEKLPPELRAEIREYLLDLALRSYYHYRSIHLNLLSIMAAELKNNEKSGIIDRAHELSQGRQGEERALLMAIYFSLHGRYGRSEADLVKKSSVSLVRICDHLLEAGDDALALKMLSHAYDPRHHDKDIAARLIFLYVRLKDHTRLEEIAVRAYKSSADIKYMDILKREISTETYAAILTKLKVDLLAEKADPNLLIRLYRKEEDWAGLMSYLEALGSVEMLMQYDGLLYKFQRPKLIEVYTKLIVGYLEDHIGEHTYQYLSNIKVHIAHQQMDALERKVREVLHEKFAHRPALLEVFG